MESIEELKKKKQLPVSENAIAKVETETLQKKEVSEEFADSLNPDDRTIFEEIKDKLVNKFYLYPFEVLDEENIEDMPELIKYFKHGVLSFEGDGIMFKLRKELVLDAKKGRSVKSLVYLYEHNQARQNQFTKYIKVKPGNFESMTDITRAGLAGSIKSADVDGIHVIVSPNNLTKIDKKDYQILNMINNFFR